MSARVVRWSKAVCAMLGQPGPMSPRRAAQTLANRLDAGLFFCDVLTNLHLHLQHKADLERGGASLHLQFSEF